MHDAIKRYVCVCMHTSRVDGLFEKLLEWVNETIQDSSTKFEF